MRSSTALASSSSGSGRPSACLGAVEQLGQAVLAERMEDQHAGPRQKRRIELEGRVLGGGADQDDGAVLHDRQEASPAGRG